MSGETIVGGNGDVKSQIVELRAEVKGLRDVLTERQAGASALDLERNKRYDAIADANARAVAAALAAAEKAVAAAFASSEQATKTAFESSEKAVAAAFASSERAAEKFASTLDEYKKGANEWRDTVKDLIGNLRESRSAEKGHQEQRTEVKNDTKWILGVCVSAGIGLAALLITLFVKAH